ncbi:peptide transporter family 1-like isoform X2 [Homalodisca vitripennis]|uniref:peptide transporter family 1-like isoform X2 n=1 Tax=Homalodisca vitripennis TaxID=197043 RepID=UPI001EEC3EFC|nr:peptide transporter family 1-like isoform X2 [Homalodisca vitripennis]
MGRSGKYVERVRRPCCGCEMAPTFLDDLKQKYPRSVFFIVGNEFCERFSYYGMRTILSLYLVDMLKYTEGDATLIYHAFTMLCYFFPLIGAIIADSYLGKFRTIFYLSIVYAAGNILVSAASSPLFGYDNQRSFSLFGLLLIAIGTGGIKPCVSAFGGDQFTLPQQAKQLAQFFSIFYFSINAGSLISTYITPILRHDVHCFGEDTCFPLAFGVPAILMVVSLLLFLAGKKLYICKEPQGNIIVEVSKCISHALVVSFKSKEKKEHWLDHAADKFDKTLISHTKAVLQVLFLFIPLPLFWALFDQQGSRWTFQATRMDGSLGWFTIKPDQMQVINPFLILAFIPLFDSFIYPSLAKCKLLVRPLQRLSAGGLLAAVAFIISALLEVRLEATYAVLPDVGQAQLRVFNGLECDVHMTSTLTSVSGNINALNALQITDISMQNSADYPLNFTTTPDCSQFPSQMFTGTVSLQEKQSVSIFLSSSSGVLAVSQVPGFDMIQKPDNGNPQIRVLYNLATFQSDLMFSQNGYKQNITLDKSRTSTPLVSIGKTGTFVATLGNSQVKADIELGSSGVYTLILEGNNNSTMGTLVTVTPPNSVHMLWLLPQYIIITAAEIMFSITGLEFSFTQAPVSMKSLISAAWLLTVSFGNLIVVIISEAKFFQSQVWEFLLFAVLMVIDMIIFIIIACRYQYYNPSDSETENVTKNSS